jgi:site-specific DNA-cytosine methylase
VGSFRGPAARYSQRRYAFLGYVIICNLDVSEEIPSIYKKNLHKLKPFTKVISAKNYYSPMEHVSNTLDTTCRYLYLVKYNRAITIEEALSLQGFPRKFNICVSTTQIMKQIGNTMSVNVLKEIMKEAFNCV